MGIGGVGAVMEGISASVAVLDALDLEDAVLASGAHGGTDVDVLQRRYELRLERLDVVKRLEGQLAAVKAHDVADAVEIQHAMLAPDAPVHERTYAEMAAVEEIAGILTISSPAAGALVDQSRRVCTLPPVMDVLAAGEMSWQHARIVADETEGLTPAGAAGLVAHFFDPEAPSPARGAAPGELVPSRFRAKVRAWRERHHPESIEKRHAKGVADRRMEYAPDRDSMAWLSLYLPGDTASAIWNRTTATARGLQSPDETRTLTQLRPDIAASLLLGAGTAGGETDANTAELGKVPTPRADVLVTVPVFALLGVTDEPAELDGYGPIPASMARKLVADGADSFYRVLVDPRDGAPLEIGRTRYRLTETIKQWIRMRDRKCTFPGCSNHTPDNDTDHGTAWEHGGSTGITNLAQLCPKHHRLKHNSHWTPDAATPNEPPGWTSPTGRHYKPEHPTPEPTHWPPSTLPDTGARPTVESTLPHATTPPELIAAPQPSGRPDQVHDLGSQELEDLHWHQILAGMPAWPDPPPEEPPGNTMLDPDQVPAEDPLWEAFYSTPFLLPPDPQQDASLLS
ncbi:HNH endonuclease signature motif containing protein [Paenarthrobacter sp. 22069]|uniref:HNH endonuclease signature motif containing protein n=1 Tax=Paenarthrobacter sp. 22069 TaxID=3453864 RepID=UPI003F84370F